MPKHHQHSKGAARRIVLVGNPNSGKSVFFNALTGVYVDVSNYPGTTVEITEARVGNQIFIDAPGVYGISAFNDEERVTRDVAITADVILNVVNAVYLERDLFLTQQCIDTGIPTVVAVNMLDEAAAQGLKVDLQMLSQMLGVPVVGTVAVEKKGFPQLMQALLKPEVGIAGDYLSQEKVHWLDRLGSQAEVMLYLEDDADIALRHGLKPPGSREKIYLARRERVNELVTKVLRESNSGLGFAALLGRLMLKPWTGVPLLLATLYGMYHVLGVFIAGTVVGVTEETIMIGLYEPFMRAAVERLFQVGTWPWVVLVGEFGILTMTITYVFGLLLPLVIGFYLLLALLEDTGYLPRIAVLLDRSLTAIGLNGRAVIPLVLGFGCVTMAKITTRLLGTSRERLIAITLLAITIPCSAQLGVVVGLIAPLGWPYVAIYMATIVTVFIFIGTLLHRLLPGKSSDLLIDIPPLRWPRLSNILKKTMNKSYMFIVEAAPLFALGALLITVLEQTGALLALEQVFTPLTVGWLRLPSEAATAFIMGVVRRDFGAAGLADMSLTAAQTVVSMITITLFVPCIASVIVMFKERSWQEALVLWLSAFAVAFLVGGLVARVVV
ncbi:MAG: ferrous iron transport protein B [Firmicutes bacterium]|nr:ferrous iron transport protein B [Dethiobacter sp.]MBS3889602.1 ferrous iron transport protein B [Bacillota bacterium]